MAVSTLGGVLRRLSAPDAGPDADLLDRFVRDRDGEAFAALVRRHGPMVLGVCRRALGPGPDAEDAFQATFLVLVRKAGAVRPRGMVGNFLYGVAVRTAAHARASVARRRAKHRGLTDMADPRPAGRDPDDLAAVIDAELARLPDKYREAVVLCELEGRSLKEAAGLLGVPPGTLASRLGRGRRLLADRLAGRGVAATAAGLTAWFAGEARAGVPARLADAAARLAGAGGVAGGISELTNGVLKTMLAHKLKAAGRAAVAVGVVVLGAAALVGPAANSAPPPRDHPTRRPAVAPVKPDPAASAKQLEAWWADLMSSDDRKATRAVLALSARPKEAVNLLKGKLQPLKADREQVKKWLADLGSDKDEVWKPAFERMTYLDPRLAIDLETLMADVTGEPSRPRLVAILTDSPPDALYGCTIELNKLQDGDGFNFSVVEPANPQNQNRGRKYSTWAEHRVDRVGRYKSSWVRAVRSVVLLEHIGTPDARAVLEVMAAGHPDALPTRAAKEALGRLREKAP